MTYIVSLTSEADIPSVLAALEPFSFGPSYVTQPFPRTPRVVHVEGPGLHDAEILALDGVASVADPDATVSLDLVTEQDAGHWHIGAISGEPHSQYAWDEVPFYLCDSLPHPDLVPEITWIYIGIDGLIAPHGNYMGDIAARVYPGPIYCSQALDGYDHGTVATITAALSAICDHYEDGGYSLGGVISASLSIGGLTNPFAAVMDRAYALGLHIVSSTGNDGDDIVASPRWPAAGATLSVGAMDANYRRWDLSNYPADIYAGGVSVDVLRTDGTTLTGASGTSAATPIVARTLWRALREGMDVDAILGMAQADVTAVPGGLNLRLYWPSTEGVDPPPPPPPPTGKRIEYTAVWSENVSGQQVAVGMNLGDPTDRSLVAIAFACVDGSTSDRFTIADVRVGGVSAAFSTNPAVPWFEHVGVAWVPSSDEFADVEVVLSDPAAGKRWSIYAAALYELDYTAPAASLYADNSGPITPPDGGLAIVSALRTDSAQDAMPLGAPWASTYEAQRGSGSTRMCHGAGIINGHDGSDLTVTPGGPNNTPPIRIIGKSWV